MKKIGGFMIVMFFAACFVGTGLAVGTAEAGAPAALMTAPDSKANAHNTEGIDHYNQEHWGVAHEHFMQAVEADPESAQAHYNLALALDKMGQHGDAAQHFKKASDLGKDNPEIQNSKILQGHLKMLQ